MSLSIAPSRPGTEGPVLIRDASWRLYQSFLREIEERGGNTRLTYNNGKLEIMSPLPEHEGGKRLIGLMIEAMTLERRIPRKGFGSTTFSNRLLKKGLEPDECYYFANEALVRGMKRFDPAVHPAPDLAVEIDISYRALKREPIYAALGVPEVWRYDGKKIECLVLNPGGTYDVAACSKSFPFLPVGELARFIGMAEEAGENEMLLAFLEWQRTLV